MAYRERWGRDIVIDVIGYRRYGHNETDEPAYTQPTIAAKIKAHPPVSEIYAEKLIDEGVIAEEDVEREGTERREEMSAALKDLREKMELGEYEDPTVTTSAHRRTRPQRQPAGRDRGADRAPARAERGADPGAGELHDPPQAAQTARQADRRAGGGRDRIRPRRGPCLLDAADRGRPHPPHRPGHRARHLLPPPPRPPRREHRPQVLPDAEPRRGHAPRSSSTTARSRRSPASASSTATRRRTRTRWCSGRRSTATSPTPAR